MNTIQVEHKDDYLIIHLSRGRSNPINAEMVDELRTVFKDADKDDNVRGIILTGQRKFFSVGLDVIDLYSYDPLKMEKFWDDFLDMIQEMSSFSKPFISAITGYSPAGGCLMAICSDYRIMLDMEKFRIGLNEVPVGIIIPSGLLHLYGFWIGLGKAYQMLLRGHLFTPKEALAAGLVDELVLTHEEVLEQAERQMSFYLSLPQNVWRRSKKNMKKELLENSKITKKDREQVLEQWWSEESRSVLKKIVERLPKKKA